MPEPDYLAAMQRTRRLQSEAFWRIMGLAARALKRLADRRRARRARQRAIAALLTIDRRGLSDLGLTRSHVPFAVDRGRDEPPVPANSNIDTAGTSSAA